MYTLGASPMVTRLIQKVKAAPRPAPAPPRATITVPRTPLLRSVVAKAHAAAVAPRATFQAEQVQLLRAAAPIVPAPRTPMLRGLLQKAQARARAPLPVPSRTMFARLRAKAIARRPPGSTGPVPVTAVERAALQPAVMPALTMPATSPFSLVPQSAPAAPSVVPSAGDVYTDYENMSEQESEPLEDLAPAESSDIPDWMANLEHESPAARDPEGAATEEPKGEQLDPLDELEQYEELGAAGDLSQQEVDTLKVQLAQRTGATGSIPWGPLVLLGGLLLWSYSQGGPRGRRGWGR